MDNVHFSSKTDMGHKNAAPFPSAIVVFGGEVKQAKENP